MEEYIIEMKMHTTYACLTEASIIHYRIPNTDKGALASSIFRPRRSEGH